MMFIGRMAAGPHRAQACLVWEGGSRYGHTTYMHVSRADGGNAWRGPHRVAELSWQEDWLGLGKHCVGRAGLLLFGWLVHVLRAGAGAGWPAGGCSGRTA